MVALGLVSTAAHALPRKPQSVNTKVNSLSKRIEALEAIVNRNQDSAANNPASLLNKNWYKNITISGEFEPVLAYNNRSFNFGGHINDDAARSAVNGKSAAIIQNDQVSEAYMDTMELYLDAKVNNFTDIHAALDYDYNWDKFGWYSLDDGRINSADKELFFSEANVRFSNLSKSGFYTVIGKQFFNFGSYQHASINAPFTELMSKNNGTGITAGFVSNTGFNVDGFVENGLLDKRSDFMRFPDRYPNQASYTHSPRLRTWGLNAGYTMANRDFNFNAQLSYINNLAQNYYFAHSIFERASGYTPNQNKTFYQNTPGMAAHLGLSSGPFALIFDYVSALSHFAPSDLLTEYAVGEKAKGAKPSATFTQLSYNFNMFKHMTTAYVAYQTTAQAQQMYDSALGGFLMPKNRTTLGLEYMLASNTKLNLEYDHDKDYSHNDNSFNTGSGRSSDDVMLGLDVKF